MSVAPLSVLQDDPSHESLIGHAELLQYPQRRPVLRRRLRPDTVEAQVLEPVVNQCCSRLRPISHSPGRLADDKVGLGSIRRVLREQQSARPDDFPGGPVCNGERIARSRRRRLRGDGPIDHRLALRWARGAERQVADYVTVRSEGVECGDVARRELADGQAGGLDVDNGGHGQASLPGACGAKPVAGDAKYVSLRRKPSRAIMYTEPPDRTQASFGVPPFSGPTPPLLAAPPATPRDPPRH